MEIKHQKRCKKTITNSREEKADPVPFLKTSEHKRISRSPSGNTKNENKKITSKTVTITNGKEISKKTNEIVKGVSKICVSDFATARKTSRSLKDTLDSKRIKTENQTEIIPFIDKSLLSSAEFLKKGVINNLHPGIVRAPKEKGMLSDLGLRSRTVQRHSRNNKVNKEGKRKRRTKETLQNNKPAPKPKISIQQRKERRPRETKQKKLRKMVNTLKKGKKENKDSETIKLMRKRIKVKKPVVTKASVNVKQLDELAKKRLIQGIQTQNLNQVGKNLLQQASIEDCSSNRDTQNSAVDAKCDPSPSRRPPPLFRQAEPVRFQNLVSNPKNVHIKQSNGAIQTSIVASSKKGIQGISTIVGCDSLPADRPTSPLHCKEPSAAFQKAPCSNNEEFNKLTHAPHRRISSQQKTNGKNIEFNHIDTKQKYNTSFSKIPSVQKNYLQNVPNQSISSRKSQESSLSDCSLRTENVNYHSEISTVYGQKFGENYSHQTVTKFPKPNRQSFRASQSFQIVVLRRMQRPLDVIYRILLYLYNTFQKFLTE
ncbi:uncharacterized protein LOC118195256 [Stegodyphus dumicola]|uniref:uncharacterized protein LOC118195256 n=1 Tax=Stegodyphus dumicola TaxID=202533 RepID=UPI0015A9D689|nr:uncharacterized protein LOC118195256 [Stegodyphus dumicola]XP_035222410.1 uncharacterized protein LOC118195256 [Stegodyphus dumicola]